LPSSKDETILPLGFPLIQDKRRKKLKEKMGQHVPKKGVHDEKGVKKPHRNERKTGENSSMRNRLRQEPANLNFPE